MSAPIVQSHSLILPTYHPLGTEVEDIDDLVTHVSSEFYCADIQEKKAQIVAIENVTAGVPGNLRWWVELSPVPSTVSTAYWAAIGGGGGALAPLTPNIIVGTGVQATTHTDLLAWTIHSEFARLVVQTPVAAAVATAIWQLQLILSGKT
ncbi:hypothetical protein LCGC14_3131640 [marine sediment metagenome]|uniref:Uncharacterized protein n=1 Tax=marine sediment metagenome TaxID=412755 RepID=A0A0F8YNV5_9ZZZZ